MGFGSKNLKAVRLARYPLRRCRVVPLPHGGSKATKAIPSGWGALGRLARIARYRPHHRPHVK